MTYKGGFVFKSPIDLYSFDAVGLYAKTFSQTGGCNAITLAAYSTSGAQIWSSGSLDLSKTQWTSWKNVKVGKAGVKQLKIIAKNTSGKPGWCWPSFKNFKVGSGGSGGSGGPIKDVKGSSLKSGYCFGQCPTNSMGGMSKSCVGKAFNHAGNKYNFKVASAGTYKVAVKWGDSTYSDKTYLRWDAEPTKGSNLKSVEGTKMSGGCSASACGNGKGNGDKNRKMTYSASLSAGTHTLYIGSIKDGNYFTVPWCDITLIGA